MQEMLQFLGMIYDLLNMPINVYGFEFSWWGIIMFTLIVGVIFGFVRRMFYEN